MRARLHGRGSGTVLIAGLLSAVVGAVLVTISLATPSPSFGWFAYAPLAETTFVPAAGPGGRAVFGYALAIAGLLVLAWWLGRRRSPRPHAPLLPDASGRTRTTVSGLVVAAALALLTGSFLLLAAPRALLGMPERYAAPQDVSVAYRSDLTVTWDDAYGPSLAPGLILLVVGLALAAVALGWRTGRPDPSATARTRGPAPAVVTGLSCVVVGLTFALLPDPDAGASPAAVAGSTPVVWFLLIAGLALGAGVAGFVLGARRRQPGD